MKKVCTLVLILVVLNFIFGCFFGIARATGDLEGVTVDFTQDDFDSMTQTGTAEVETSSGKVTKKVGMTQSTMGSGTGKFASTTVPFVAGAYIWMSEILYNGGLSRVAIDTSTGGDEPVSESEYGVDKHKMLTIEGLVFGEYMMLDGKAYQTTAQVNPEVKPTIVTKIMDQIKEKGTSLFKLIRIVSLTLSVPLFIYAIIRVMGAQTAKDLAIWKKVLGKWAVSIALLFFVPYIFIAMHYVNDMMVDVFWKGRLNLENNYGYRGIEVAIETGISDEVNNTGGTLSMAYGLEYMLLTVLQLLFAFKYFKRAFTLMFCFIFSPAIITKHSIATMTGKESKSLKELFAKYGKELYIQPLHAFLYMIALFALSETAITIPVLGIALMFGLYRGEKIVKMLLHLD